MKKDYIDDIDACKKCGVKLRKKDSSALFYCEKCNEEIKKRSEEFFR